jgi:DNA-binding MarR family transcriptional regulator
MTLFPFVDENTNIQKTIRILKYISANPGRRVREIAIELGYKSSFVLMILDPLEKRGVVWTTPDDGNQARYYVTGRKP